MLTPPQMQTCLRKRSSKLSKRMRRSLKLTRMRDRRLPRKPRNRRPRQSKLVQGDVFRTRSIAMGAAPWYPEWVISGLQLEDVLCTYQVLLSVMRMLVQVLSTLDAEISRIRVIALRTRLSQVALKHAIGRCPLYETRDPHTLM